MHLLIYCAGGFGMEVMDIARRLNRIDGRWSGIGFLDDTIRAPKTYDANVFHFEDALSRFGPSGMEVAIANGEPFVRKALRDKVAAAGIKLANIIDSTAMISETAIIGDGTIIFPGCFVSSEASIGCNVAIIAGALIGHHSALGDNCIISGQVNIGGACIIGSESYIGMGAQIKEHIKVGCASIVGMGSIVFRDIPDEVVALGNPCRPMKPNTDKKVFN
jgi:sugar O-acyltransferase (sialic acid O-acetyltransferase NeuD family)